MKPEAEYLCAVPGDGLRLPPGAPRRLSPGQFAIRRFRLLILAVLLDANIASAQNRVLELDGFSYVELPPNIFNNLTQATVEVWAKWDSFRTYSRVFEFGAAYQSMSLFNHATTSDLRFNLYPEKADKDPALLYAVRVNGLLTTNEWIHLAAVSGPGGMKLYANGALVGEHTNSASFADINVSHTNFFGRGLSRRPGDQDFRGLLDEIRVWDHRRTEAQIRDYMRKRLTGNEEGLAGLWNFEDGSANDSSPHAYRGKLIGNARVVTADSQQDGQLLGFEPPPRTRVNAASPPANALAIVPPNDRDTATWWIAGALSLIVALLAWLVLMFKRGGFGAPKLLPATSAQALLTEGGAATKGAGPSTDEELKRRALEDLTEFAKQSLVQGLYSQRNALLETQQKAQRQLAELEARLVALNLPDRIQAYEKRIGELEKELGTRSDEVRELTSATLLLLRRKLEEEKQAERKSSGFN